jgi:hypothetical protein
VFPRSRAFSPRISTTLPVLALSLSLSLSLSQKAHFAEPKRLLPFSAISTIVGDKFPKSCDQWPREPARVAHDRCPSLKKAHIAPTRPRLSQSAARETSRRVRSVTNV